MAGPCLHREFAADVGVGRMYGDGQDQEVEPPLYLMLEITAKCAECGKPVRFLGAPRGLSPRHPAMDVDGSELRAPGFVDGSEESAIEMLEGLPGFTIRGGMPG